MELPERTTRSLDGLKVVEASQFMTGPFAALFLADLGADVVKVEQPSGDSFRRFGHKHRGLSAQFVSANRDRSSVTLDLKSEADRDRMVDLLSDADVFIHNWRPGVAESFGLDHDTLAARNAGLISVAISGYGPTGPRSTAPAFDALIQAQSGLGWIQQRFGAPDVLTSWVADKLSGLVAAQCVLAALVERTRTGRGACIDVPMLDVLAYFNFPDVFEDRTFIDDDTTLEPVRSTALRTQDGFLVLAPVTGAQIGRALECVGRGDAKPDLKAATSPRELMDRFCDLLEEVLLTAPTATWLERFRAADVPAAPLHDRDEHLRDEQVLHNELYSVLDTPAGPARAVRFPGRFDGQVMRPRRGAPALGSPEEPDERGDPSDPGAHPKDP